MIIRPGTDTRAPAEQRQSTFSGTVFAHPVHSAPGVTIASVLFTPCARTFWHHHERGQILHVTAGSGLVCTEGDEPVVIRVGDVVWVPPGEMHWHGAAPGTFLNHLAISLGATSWADEVSEAEYSVTPSAQLDS